MSTVYDECADNVVKILRKLGAISLKTLKEQYHKEYNEKLPFEDTNDDNVLHQWLSQKARVKQIYENGSRFYRIDDGVKRKSSPILQTPSKRSRSAPSKDNDNEKENDVKPVPKEHQSRKSVRFEDKYTPRSTRNSNRNLVRETYNRRSRSENRPPLRNLMIGTPNLHGSIFISDEFLIGYISKNLNYRIYRSDGGRPEVGHCISGQTIAKATNRVLRCLDPAKAGTVIIYLGSIDIIIGRELIEMQSDLHELIAACLQMNKKPILCTLAPIPTHQTSNQVAILKGFNEYLIDNTYGLPVINTSKVFMKNDEHDVLCYYKNPTQISGYGFKSFVLFWSKEGSDRFHRMLLKNLGHAIIKNSKGVLEYYD